MGERYRQMMSSWRLRRDDTGTEDAYEATTSGGFPSFFPSARFRTTT